MSKTTSDPEKYYRSGIAIPLARKPVFEQRLHELDLKTIGDLTTMFIMAPGVVEALKPIAASFRAHQEQEKANSPRRKKLIDQLKALSPEELQALVATAAAQKAA